MENYLGETFLFGGSEFCGSNMGTLLHKATQTLILSDCHFGKATHFRKNGIPMPNRSSNPDRLKMTALIRLLQPRVLVFLGDLFHSDMNSEWKFVEDLCAEFPETEFVLVQGNHDIMDREVYLRSGIRVVPEYSLTDEILLSHEPVETPEGFNICGHIHPGFHIRLGSRQGVLLPCFFIPGNRLIMPAFGNLTGLVNQKNKQHKAARVLCYTPEKMFWGSGLKEQ